MSRLSPFVLLAVLAVPSGCADDTASDDPRQSDPRSDPKSDRADSSSCPDPSDPAVVYVSEEVLECAALLFECPDEYERFDDECGCGCVARPAGSCPDPADPRVHYIGDSARNPLICTVILFGCEEGQIQFSDECGCGCIDPA